MAGDRLTRENVGRALDVAGQAGLPLGMGALGGYYASDRGVLFLPTFLSVVTLGCLLSLIAIWVGRDLMGKAKVVEYQGRTKLRKRVMGLLALAGFAAVVQLGIFYTQNPSPLTRMPAEDFDVAFELDAKRYREHDAGLERCITQLERRGLFSGKSKTVLDAADEDFLLDVWQAFYNYGFALDQIRKFWEDWYRFDPSRAQRSYHLRSFLLTYAAEASLYEKTLRFTTLVERNETVKNLLDSPHPKRGLPSHAFSRLRASMLGVRDQSRIVAGRAYLKWLQEALDGRVESGRVRAGWLWSRLRQHLASIDDVSKIQVADEGVRADMQLFKRGVTRVWFPVQKGVAEWMGDTRVKRPGRYLIDKKQQAAIDKKLKPGDVLLSRKNWYLSNVGLPGFWPHAILYVGDHGKLSTYFDDPAVHRLVEDVSGKKQTLPEYLADKYPASWARYRASRVDDTLRVIEAISEGVLLNTLHAAAGDYLAALRPRLSKVEKARAVMRAFKHLGKPYDFDFDFATRHTLVCTELVWRAYRPAGAFKGLNVPLEQVMGRTTLPANGIAALYSQERGKSDAQLDFVVFYDAREHQQRAVESTEAEFAKTYQRTKWDVAQK